MSAELRRKKDTIHAADCRYAKDALTWIWAADKTRAQIKASEVNGLRFCKVCKPLERVPS